MNLIGQYLYFSFYIQDRLNTVLKYHKPIIELY